MPSADEVEVAPTHVFVAVVDDAEAQRIDESAGPVYAHRRLDKPIVRQIVVVANIAAERKSAGVEILAGILLPASVIEPS